MARLPACSQKHLPLHSGSIHVLNLMYSLQRISHALTSHLDMCVHICTQVYKAYLYIFSSFIHMRPCHAHGILFFTTLLRCSWSFPGALVLSIPFTYFLPSWLLGHQWTLPCESQTLGDTGYDRESWDPCDHHALEEKVGKLFFKIV